MVRISRTETGVTRYHSTDLMGLLVEYLVVTPQDVPLGTAAALSAATVALTGPTQVPLASSPAQSDATLALSAPTQVPLGTAAAQSDATLALRGVRRRLLDRRPGGSTDRLLAPRRAVGHHRR